MTLAKSISALLLTAACLMACPTAKADGATPPEGYMVEIEPGKKTVYPDRLGLPGHAYLTDALHLIPELINRGDMTYDKFDIQFDDHSIGESRDVILSQLRIEDVEKITISTSPVSTHSNNGQSGSINIVPRKKRDGFGGRAFLEGDFCWGLMPGVNLGYKKGNLEIGAIANFEYLDVTRRDGYVQTSGGEVMRREDAVTRNNFQQTAKVDMRYTFSEKDELKAWLVESWHNSRQRTISTSDTRKDTLLSPAQSLILEGSAEYQHKFTPDSKITVSADYSSQRSDTYSIARMNRNFPFKVKASVKFTHPLVMTSSRSLTMKAGVSTSYDRLSSSDISGNAVYASPSVELKYRQSNLSVDAAVQYQFYDRRVQNGSKAEMLAATNHDFTSHANAVWQVVPHHALRFNASRNLIRPKNEMLYPGYTYYPSKEIWILGNPDLKNAYIHSFDIIYIHDWKHRGHEMVFNAGVGYDLAKGVHESQVLSQSSFPEFYTTYTNTGTNNIAKGNVMLVYKYKVLTLAFAGNVFFNSIDHRRDEYAFYNLSLSPIFNFSNNWTVSCRALYNSAIKRRNANLGQCIFIQAKVSKDIQKWTISLILNDLPGFKTKDLSFTADGIITNTYNLYTSYAGLHLSRRF